MVAWFFYPILLAVGALLSVGATLLTPKKDDPKELSTDSIDVPTADPTRSIPKLAGTNRVGNQNMIAWGGLHHSVHNEDDSYRNDDYATGLYCLCHGPLNSSNGDALLAIYANDKKVWPLPTKTNDIDVDISSGTIKHVDGTHNGEIYIHNPDLFGEQRGGFGNRAGETKNCYTAEVWSGASTQTQSDYLREKSFDPTTIQAILNTPPVTTDFTEVDQGNKWIIGDSPTGEWLSEGTSGYYAILGWDWRQRDFTWHYMNPTDNIVSHVLDTDTYYQYINQTWTEIDTEVSAYRGVVCVFFKDFHFGSTQAIPKIEFLTRVLPNSNAFNTSDTEYLAGERWKIASYTTTLEDGQTRTEYNSNPMCCLWDLLTDNKNAAGIASGFISGRDFLKCANVLYNESFGIGYNWDSASSPDTLINQINKTINGFYFTDISTGKIGYTLPRGDYPLTDQTSAFSIVSSLYDTLSIADATLTLSDSTNELEINLLDADYNNLDNLTTYLNGLTDTTCTITGTDYAAIHSTWLTEITDADISSSYSVALTAIPSLNENSVVDIKEMGSSTWQDALNTKTITYYDPQNDYKETPVRAQDLGGLYRDNKVKGNSENFKMIRSNENASSVCNRALYIASQPIKSLKVIVNRTSYNYKPGDVFVLSWDDLGIDTLYCRIIEVNYGKLDDSKITLTVSEDVFALEHNYYTAIPARNVPPQLLISQPVVNSYELEVPYHFIKDIYNPNDDTIFLSGLAENPCKGLGYKPHLSVSGKDMYGGETPVYHKLDKQFAFTPSGTLGRELLENSEDTDLIINVQDHVPGLLQDEQTEGMIRNQNCNIGIIVPNEHSRYDDFTVVNGYDEIISYTHTTYNSTTKQLTLHNFNRGHLDSVVRSHNAGVKIYLLPNGINWFSFQYSQYDTALLKYQTVGTRDTLHTDNAESVSFDIERRAAKPYPPGNILMEQNSISTCFPTVFNWGDDVTLNWAKRNKETQYQIYMQDDANTKTVETYDSTTGYSIVQWSDSGTGDYEGDIASDSTSFDMSLSTRNDWFDYEAQSSGAFELYGKADRTEREYESSPGAFLSSRAVVRQWNYAGNGLSNIYNGGASPYD
jgi:Putative phage tail protein